MPFKSRRVAKPNRKKELLELQEERKNLLSVSDDFFVREAYKTLRTNVNFALTGESACKVIVVTSSLQSEGKSITAANLAISLADADNRVLLIDCDLRRPKMSRLLNLRAPAGLSNLLMKPELLREAIQNDVYKGLDVILAGDIPPNPSELLGSMRMERLLEALKKKYQYILLDCPPINMVTDAMVLAPQSDGVLFVVRANQSERGAVVHAVDQLSYAKVKILGFVLNGVNMEQSSYGKYRYKKNGYYTSGGYGYESASRPVEDESVWDLGTAEQS